MIAEQVEKAQLLAWLERYRSELDANVIQSFEDLIGVERVSLSAKTRAQRVTSDFYAWRSQTGYYDKERGDGKLCELIAVAIDEEREAISQKAEAKAREIEPDNHDRDYAENDSAGFNADRQTARALREFACEIRACKSKGD